MMPWTIQTTMHKLGWKSCCGKLQGMLKTSWKSCCGNLQGMLKTRSSNMSLSKKGSQNPRPYNISPWMYRDIYIYMFFRKPIFGPTLGSDPESLLGTNSEEEPATNKGSPRFGSS